MKSFFDYNIKNGTPAKPNELNKLYLDAVLDYREDEFFNQFDFASQEEIKKAIKRLAYSITGDAYFGKANRDNNNVIRATYQRWNALLTNNDKWEKYPVAKSGQLWGGYFGRKRLNDNFNAMFSNTPDRFRFKEAKERIKNIYKLTDDDVKKLHFFIEQVKARELFPNSLRRMLYIWGAAKQTGKTTSAKMIVCILNGETDFNNYSKFETTLQNEMQIGEFKVPKISECNCAFMDECFYSDMSKTYNDLKRKITTSNGVARLPYGQAFEWHGQPNYVATSNEPLKNFIKDYNDRRYLSIEFKTKPSESLTFEGIYELWKEFITNSEQPMSWKDWAGSIETISEEMGEYQEFTNEYENELKSSDFLNMITAKPISGSREANDNRRTLKFFIDYFAIKDNTARKKRRSIEQAVISVFGEKPNGKNYWVHEDLYEVAIRLTSDKQQTKQTEYREAKDEDLTLPF